MSTLRRISPPTLFLTATTLAFVACGDARYVGNAQPDATVTVRPDAVVVAPDDATVAADAPAGDAVVAPDVVVGDSGADAGGGDAGPTPDGVRIAGLTATVSVSFDAYGITHIRCQTDSDCFAAQGYYHAADRFAQMDLRRRFVRGRIAELFGDITGAVVDQDYSSRLFLATADGRDLAESLLAAASPETRAMLDAYTVGVNAWLADLRAGRNGARVAREWEAVAMRTSDWQPVDSVAGIIALVASLTNSTQDDIDRGLAAAAMPPQEFFDLYGVMPASSAATTDVTRSVRRGPAMSPAMIERFRVLQSQLALAESALLEARQRVPQRLDLAGEDFGSNNWVVAPSLARDGRSAYLANDPHLGMTNPATWYLVHLDSRSAGRGGRIHAAGASFAGMPGIILGQNEDIAWGATTTFFDQADVYLEQLSVDRTGVVRNGQTVPFTQRMIEISVLDAVGGQMTVTRPALYVPGHGPVLSIDVAAGTAVTSRWTGHNLSTDINFPWEIMTASTEAEARQAFRASTSIGQNFVTIDRQGNIGWYPYNYVPNRPWIANYPAWVPVPGDGRFEWDGAIPEADLPQIRNPARGFIATANSDMTGQLYDGIPYNDGLRYIQSGVDPGYRQERIAQVLNSTITHTIATMEALQNDIVSLPGRYVTPPVLRAATASVASLTALGREVDQALRGWTRFTCPTGLAGIEPTSPATTRATELSESAGCAAFHVVLGRLYANVFADEMARRNVTDRPNISSLFIQILTPERFLNPAGYWDDVSTVGRVETSTNAYVQALNEAGAWLGANLGMTRAEWQWGRVHTVRLRADLFSGAGMQQFDSPPFASAGGLFTVDVANPNGAANHNYTFGSGPSMRFSCEANSTRPVRCTIDLPGGQRHFPNDPHDLDLMREHWLTRTRVPLHFLTSEVSAAAVETVSVRAP